MTTHADTIELMPDISSHRPALRRAAMGASGRPTIRPGLATVRRARIHIGPSRLLGHLDSDVSRCRSITRAAR